VSYRPKRNAGWLASLTNGPTVGRVALIGSEQGFGAGRRPTGRSAPTRGSLQRLVAPIGSRCRSSES